MGVLRMDNAGNKSGQRLEVIDFSQLMDLRVDYAFKLLFSKGDPLLLVSLLNAIFANKGIPRRVTSLVVVNPYLEKGSANDKESVLDIRATLEDGASVLVEMHLRSLGELKAKTIRSWARAYGEALEEGASYAGQPPTICVTFADGQIRPSGGAGRVVANQGEEKIHRLCMIMDCEDHSVFTDSMELHYIDMKAFARVVNEAGSIDIAAAGEGTC